MSAPSTQERILPGAMPTLSGHLHMVRMMRVRMLRMIVAVMS